MIEKKRGLKKRRKARHQQAAHEEINGKKKEVLLEIWEMRQQQ